MNTGRPVEVYTLVFDVSDEKAVDDGVSQIEKDCGPIDILVNNAGIIKRIPILNMNIIDFKDVLDADLVAPLILAKRVAPGMIARTDYSKRGFYLEIFGKMAKRFASLQQADGLWRASLLDPDAYPGGEASGSGFYCYAMV